jgi:hypothetical protein
MIIQKALNKSFNLKILSSPREDFFYTADFRSKPFKTQCCGLKPQHQHSGHFPAAFSYPIV